MQTTTHTARRYGPAEAVGQPLHKSEVRLTAYDAAEREYELVCTVEYGEDAGGRLMVVDAHLTFDREDVGADARLAAALACALATDRRHADEDRAEAAFLSSEASCSQ